MVRLILTLLCALGLVSMHQLAAAAMPKHGSPAAHSAKAPMEMLSAHDCSGDDAVAVTAPEDCAAHQVCQAMPASSRTAPAPPAIPVTVAPLATTDAVGCALPGSLPASGDPPDLNVLSVART